MRLSIMPLLVVHPSQSASHPHCHQRQVRRPREHEGVHQHVVPPPGSCGPFGWELATTAEGILYYLDHNRGITIWERPQLPPYPAAPPKPPKHCLPVAKRPLKQCHLKLLLYYGGTVRRAVAPPCLSTRC